MRDESEEAVERFLTSLGLDLKKLNMEKTPNRVSRLYQDLFSGLGKKTEDVWGEVFPTDYSGLVAITKIPVYSVCEHHLMPFFGTVDIIYHPKDGRVVGLSKMRDLVEVLSRRPQLQERLTAQIADAIEQDLEADGVFIHMQCTQLCMLIRGEMELGSQAITVEGRGVLSQDGPFRQEAITILGGQKHDV